MKKHILLALILVASCSFAFAQTHKAPPMSGTLPQISGATWGMFNIYDKSKTPPKPNGSLPSFAFCKSNNWMMTPKGVGESGTYTVEGNKLSLTYGKTGKPSVYIMTWDPKTNVLKLEGTTTVMLWEYSGASNCN